MIYAGLKKIDASTHTDHASAFWDVMPTVADLIGVEKPINIDGVSFLSTLTGGPQKEHDYLYWEFHEHGGRQALQKGDRKLVKYNVNAEPVVPLELYNLEDDPGEEVDLAQAHPERLKELKNLMKNARSESKGFHFGSRNYGARE